MSEFAQHKVHLLGMLAGEKFRLRPYPGSPTYTVAQDPDGLVRAIDPSGQILPSSTIANLNGLSYFVYVVATHGGKS